MKHKGIFVVVLYTLLALYTTRTSSQYNFPLFVKEIWTDEQIENSILKHLQSGQAKHISSYMTSSVSVSILKEDGYYAKYQAERLLASFLSKYKPESVKRVQKITKFDNYNYLVFVYKSESHLFRIFLKLHALPHCNLIEELRIEKQLSK